MKDAIRDENRDIINTTNGDEGLFDEQTRRSNPVRPTNEQCVNRAPPPPPPESSMVTAMRNVDHSQAPPVAGGGGGWPMS